MGKDERSLHSPDAKPPYSRTISVWLVHARIDTTPFPSPLSYPTRGFTTIFLGYTEHPLPWVDPTIPLSSLTQLQRDPYFKQSPLRYNTGRNPFHVVNIESPFLLDRLNIIYPTPVRTFSTRSLDSFMFEIGQKVIILKNRARAALGTACNL